MRANFLRSFCLKFGFIFLLSVRFFESNAQLKDENFFIKSVERILNDQFKSSSPGFAILVANKGKVIYRKAFGVADLELNVLCQPETIFKLGSITKQFTAVAILQLVEQGKLSLKDSVQKFIKDFPSGKHFITIENLLSHTSGITDYTQLNISDPFIRRKDLNPKEVINYFKNEPLEFEPGTKFRYSNSNFFLLGHIIELIEGRDYQTVVAEKLFRPIGLTNTFYDDFYKVIHGRAKGYKQENGVYKNADFQSATIPFAAGALLSNVDDLLKWHRSLYELKLIKKETLEQATKPFELSDGTKSNYGFGWFIVDLEGTQSIQHGGNISGFKSNEIYFPKEDIFIAALSNCECTPMEELSQQLALLAIGKIYNTKGVILSDTILAKYVGKYVMPLDPKRPIIISQEGSHLFAGVQGEWKAELAAISETRFDVKNIRPAGTIAFFKNSDGKIVKLIMTQSGKDYESFRSE